MLYDLVCKLFVECCCVGVAGKICDKKRLCVADVINNDSINCDIHTV